MACGFLFFGIDQNFFQRGNGFRHIAGRRQGDRKLLRGGDAGRIENGRGGISGICQKVRVLQDRLQFSGDDQRFDHGRQIAAFRIRYGNFRERDETVADDTFRFEVFRELFAGGTGAKQQNGEQGEQAGVDLFHWSVIFLFFSEFFFDFFDVADTRTTFPFFMTFSIGHPFADRGMVSPKCTENEADKHKSDFPNDGERYCHTYFPSV